MNEYLKLLKENLLIEADTVTLYNKAVELAPKEDIPTLLEIINDEVDHIKKFEELINKAAKNG